MQPCLAVVALAVGVLGWQWRPGPVTPWRTAKVERGDITQRIQATGTLNALIQVSVGTQVSGVVTALHADCNSLVRKGQVLARIDPAVLGTQLAEARAAVEGATGTYDNAKAELERYEHLAAEQLVSGSDLDTRRTAFRTARASLASARAALGRAGMNLGYCTIKAPVDGVVIARVVDVGQTVAASLSAPSLFTVARDLSRMKLQAAVDEADIGLVHVGQQATFTVDSYPDQVFRAVVSEVQLNPTVSSNVVTYSVVMGVANLARPTAGVSGDAAAVPRTALYIPEGSPVYRGDMALFPGMTANVTLAVDCRKGVLRVPNAALRFNPEGMAGEGGGHLWILEGGRPRRLAVRAGLSDSQFTEVSGEGLREGLEILVGTGGKKKAETPNSALVASPAGGPPPPPA
jgi:HlyD family secretion protein